MKTSLRLITILLFAVVLVSCKGKKANAEKIAEDGFVQGTIVTERAEQGCPVLVRVKIDDKLQLHRPISLPEEFAQDGIKIKFKYRKSRAPQKDCEEGMPLIVSEVTKI